MGDFTGSINVNQGADAVFDYLSDVGNLPQYFSRMTSAEPADGEAIETTAKLPDGREVNGEAWFKVDHDARRIEWGSEGPSDYSGYLDVSGSGDSARVEVHLHTTRVEDGNAEVKDGIQATLNNIKSATE